MPPSPIAKLAGLMLRLAAGLLALPGAALAQNCGSPVNYAANGTFDSGLADYASGGWRLSHATRAAVQNPDAAPEGADATSYPAATTSAFAVNEKVGANDVLTAGTPEGAHVTYFANALHIWFDMGWRQAGGTSRSAATLQVKVDGTSYMTITTAAGNATGVASNGASLGDSTPTTFSGDGTFGQWNTIHLIVPYAGTSAPTVSFVTSGGAGTSDSFAIDRIYVPMCQVSALSISKASTVISDPVNSTGSPGMMPGARVRYCIQVSNPAGNPTASSVDTIDMLSSLPVTFVPGSIRVNGTVTDSQCNWDGTSGGSYSDGTVSATLGPIAQGARATMYFDAVVN